MVFINIILGFICSIGFYSLFYKQNRPVSRWRSIVLLMAALLSCPLSALWSPQNASHISDNTAVIAQTVFVLIIFLVFVLFGANRQKMYVPAAFIFCIIFVSDMPIIYFLASIIYPIIHTPTLFDATVQFPQLQYLITFLVYVITAGCCLLAVQWMHNTYAKPPIKIYLPFCLLYVIFTFIFQVWVNGIKTILPISFLASGLMGLLLTVFQIVLFYLYTRLIKDSDKFNNEKESLVLNDYTQFVTLLSRRELELIEAVLAGNVRQKELSIALNISVNTVKTHLKHIYQVTGVSNITTLSSLFHGFSHNHPEPSLKSPLYHSKITQ